MEKNYEIYAIRNGEIDEDPMYNVSAASEDEAIEDAQARFDAIDSAFEENADIEDWEANEY